MSTQQRLSDEQERMRLEGLRILARIIVRHSLAHPEKYPARVVKDQEPPANGRPRAEGGRFPKDGGA